MAALQRDGVRQVVVNTAWLGTQIPAHLNAQLAAAQACSCSTRTSRQILAMRWKPQAVLHVPCPCWARRSGWPQAMCLPRTLCLMPLPHRPLWQSNDLAHVWLVPNPAHHVQGDFGLDESAPGSGTGRALNLPPADISRDALPRWTYSTIALLKAELLTAPWCELAAGNPTGVAAPLAPLLRRAMDAGRCGATLYTGRWTDVGTPERLAQLNAAEAAAYKK